MKKYNGISRILALALATLVLLSPVLPAAAAESGNVIYIKTAADILELAENCRMDTWSLGKIVILQADISLDGIDFQPIPSFGGTFNGNCHTISGLSLSDSITPAGFFGVLQEAAAVRNLTLSGTVSPSGKAENVGGIVGENYGTLRNCQFTGTIKGKTSVGGIVGLNGTTGKVVNCKTSGSMKGEKMTGGIVGCSLGIVEDCENSSFINTVSADKTFNPEDIDLSFSLDISKLSSLDTNNALLELAYDLCQSAGVAVSNGVYTISLDEAGMTQAAAAIAPETMDMDIAFGEGTVQIRLSGEELESISFTISGSVKVVVADVPVSLSGKLVMTQSQREFTVPEAVRKVLEK